MAQSDKRIAKQLAAQGFTPLNTQLALQALARCMLETRPQVGVIDCQWDQYLQATEQSALFLSKVATLGISTQQKHNPGTQLAVYEQLIQADATQRLGMLTKIIDTEIRKILGLADTLDVPEEQALTDQGFDSLMAVQLTNAVGRTLGQRLPVSLVFNYPTPKALASYLLDLMNSQLAPPKPEEETKLATISSSDRARSLLDDLDNLLEQS
jgi:acyl carrier protein